MRPPNFFIFAFFPFSVARLKNSVSSTHSTGEISSQDIKNQSWTSAGGALAPQVEGDFAEQQQHRPRINIHIQNMQAALSRSSARATTAAVRQSPIQSVNVQRFFTSIRLRSSNSVNQQQQQQQQYRLQTSQFANKIQYRQTRSIVFVRGQRVQGLIRDPSEILSTDGVSYGATEENLGALRNYLNSLQLSQKIELNDELLLQLITHKSFAHGSKPYNAQLSFLGEQVLQLTATTYVSKQSSDKLAAIGSLGHRLLWSDKLLAAFAESKGIDKVFFCKKALPGGKVDKLYKPKGIYSTITSSLIGAITAKYGKNIADEFIERELIPAYN